MDDFENLPDDRLVASYRSGDETAYAAIFDRYASRVCTYVWVVLGSRDAATAITREVFTEAVETLGSDEETPNLRLFLLTSARSGIRSSNRPGPVVGDAGAGAGLGDAIVRQMATLGERDRELMALHLVEGLDLGELGAVTGVDPARVDGLVAAMRGRVDRTLGPLLVAALGSEACPQMSGMLVERTGELGNTERAEISRHIGRCETCQTRRAGLMEPGSVLPGVVVAVVPPAVRRDVLAAVSASGSVVEAIPAPPVEAPPVPPATESAVAPPVANELSDTAKIVIFGLVTVILGLIGLAVSARFEPLDPPRRALVAAPRTPMTTTSTSPFSSTTSLQGTTDETPPSPAVLAVSTKTLELGDEGVSGEFEVTNSGGQSGVFTVATTSDAIVVSAGGEELGPGESVTYAVTLDRETMPEGDFAEDITVSWEGGLATIAVTAVLHDNPILHNPRATPAQVQVSGGTCTNTQTTISVRVTDRSPLEAVVARWSPDGTSRRETAMTDIGNDRYETVVGPFTAPQSDGVRIVAFDESGNAGGATAALTVVACP